MTVLPRETWPSPPMATSSSRRTETMVVILAPVACVKIVFQVYGGGWREFKWPRFGGFGRGGRDRFGGGFPKTAPCGTSLWRFCSAIHGSANFWKAAPKPIPEQCAGPQASPPGLKRLCRKLQPSLGTFRTKGWILMDTSLSTAEFIWLREVNGPTFTRYQMPPLSCVIC